MNKLSITACKNKGLGLVRILSVSIAMLGFTAGLAVSQTPDKDRIYKQLTEKYKNAKSVSIDMEASGAKTLLRAKRGNKFIIQIGELQITSNGETVWNYNRLRKTVIVSNYEDVCGDNSFNNITLDNFFFEVLPKLQPVSLAQVLSSANGKSYMLKLQTGTLAQDKPILEELEGVSIYLDNALNSIQYIEIEIAGVVQKFKINKIEVNKKMADSAFDFQIPKNTEIINN